MFEGSVKCKLKRSAGVQNGKKSEGLQKKTHQPRSTPPWVRRARNDRHYNTNMSQRHFIQNDSTMLITTVTLNRIPFFLNQAYAREAIECLYRVQGFHPFFLYGFVIMPDHIHILMKVPSPKKVSTVIGSYKSGLTFDLGIKKLWQERFHIRFPKNPSEALRYIHLNPVRKGICECPESYPWSSASGKWDVSALDV